jgi:ABC-type lipoprotein release transport system permease subunit
VNTPFFIARKYLFSKKSHNVINIISAISVFGIMISTAAMVIVLSAFNGIESLVLDLFNAFENDIKIEAAHSKTFNYTFINPAIYNDEDILNYSDVIEETVIIKNQDKYAFATLKGVDDTFLKMVNIDQYILDGKAILKDNNQQPYALVGIGVLQNLGGYIYSLPNEFDYFTVFSPNRNEKIKRNSIKAFGQSKIPVIGTFSFNNKVDETIMLTPLAFAKNALGFTNELTAIEIDYKAGADLDIKKEWIQKKLGDDFIVKTAYEQNELLFKTSKSEKWLTILLLGFIFFLGTFNMIASLAMLIIEKKDNLKTLSALGAEKSQMHHIFFYVGLLINGLGILFGLALGYLICYLQIKFGLLKMQGGMVDSFPVDIKFNDFIMILTITLIIGMLAAYVPAKLLINKLFSQKPL